MTAPVWATDNVPAASDFNVWFQNVIAAIKTSTESVTSSVTVQNDDQLVVALAANSSYHVQASILYDGATAGDIRIAWTGPSGATINGQLTGNPFNNTGFTDCRILPYTAFAAEEQFGALGTGTTSVVFFNGLVAIGSTAGNLQLQWAQGTSSGTATRVFGASFVTARRIS